MIFISRYRNYRLGIRPTIKQVVHGSSGSEELIVHKGVTVEFTNATFDTSRWREYSRPDSPDHINVIKGENDLIRLMMASPYYGSDFFERKVESVAERKAKLKEELARLDAEESASNPENAPSFDNLPSLDEEGPSKPVKSAKGKGNGKGKKSSSILL